MVPNWSWIFLGDPNTQVPGFLAMAVFWSLGIEEQFYLVWGVVLRVFQPRNIRWMAWGLIILSVITRSVCWSLDLPHPYIYANTLAHLDPIATGILLAWEWFVLESVPAAGWKHRFLRSPFCLVLGAAGFLLAGGISTFLGLNETLFVFLGYPLVAWSGYLVLFYALLNVKVGFHRGRAFRALAYFGKISYGLYIFHRFVLRIFTPWLDGLLLPGQSTPSMAYWTNIAALAVSLIATVLIGHLSYRYFEAPFLTLKEKFSPLGASRAAIVHAEPSEQPT
jgi:peptidoglycan/LPS O-acetylase OafA/YrhL